MENQILKYFIKAAEKINITPALCIVFEDAVVGVEAARAAGMKVVALTTTHPSEYFENSDAIVKNLDHVSMSQLENILKINSR
jgi:beta-phosphoglucomutase-like phosphatase (HAD superfamily)